MTRRTIAIRLGGVTYRSRAGARAVRGIVVDVERTGGDGGRWLDRYLDPDPIRTEGAFHRFAARRADDGAACVVVVAARGVARAAAGRALGALARGHAAIDHPLVPRATAHGEHHGIAFVELDCDGAIDGIELIARWITERRKISHAQLEALADRVRGALRAAADAVDAENGRPLTIRRLSLANLLVSPRGGLWLIGLGHNVAVDDERGELAVTDAVFQAPEVALGARPTAGSDFVAWCLLQRALMSHAELAAPLARVLRGAREPDDAALAACVEELDARWLGGPADRRPSAADGDAQHARLRSLLGIEPDVEGLARALSDTALGLGVEHDGSGGPDEPTEESVAFGPDAAWIDTGHGDRVKLGPSLRHVLALLLRRHAEEPGRTSSTWELLEAGWPGEVMQPDAGANRVYAAVKRLRNMGLRAILERHDEGYRIAPDAQLTRIED